MKRTPLSIVGLLLVAFLAACGAEPAAQPPVVSAAENAVDSTAPVQTAVWETIIDEQGAVSVAITPLNLSANAPTLDFEVVLDTHSVDLSMDLMTLATLTADNGRSVTATLWDAVPGGHHVSGILSFPADAAGTAVLEGASQLTLTIRDIDAPERSYVWSLPK
ncbi:MAG: hypothetical protein IAE79_12975 [Anaerolinea sp.]|nr:hypothetical protein [Anaerolinea sp.]